MVMAQNIGHVRRVDENPARGTFTLQAQCSYRGCPWKGDRVVVRDKGSDKRNAPATQYVARQMRSHLASAHDLDG